MSLRTRQASIAIELTEITSGAMALIVDGYHKSRSKVEAKKEIEEMDRKLDIEVIIQWRHAPCKLNQWKSVSWQVSSTQIGIKDWITHMSRNCPKTFSNVSNKFQMSEMVSGC